jgi:hypothetical protein
MRLPNLLSRPEQQMPDPACLRCGDRRGRIVCATAWALADGSVGPVAGHPESCERCGQVPEQVLVAVEPYVPCEVVR